MGTCTHVCPLTTSDSRTFFVLCTKSVMRCALQQPLKIEEGVKGSAIVALPYELRGNSHPTPICPGWSFIFRRRSAGGIRKWKCLTNKRMSTYARTYEDAERTDDKRQVTNVDHVVEQAWFSVHCRMVDNVCK